MRRRRHLLLPLDFLDVGSGLVESALSPFSAKVTAPVVVGQGPVKVDGEGLGEKFVTVTS